MTQKELLYVEDAIGHEANIISICEESIKNLQNEELISFLESEVEIHKQTKEKLLSLLEEKVNEWSINNG